MADEILRLGLDTRAVEDGEQRARRAYKSVGTAAREAADGNEQLSRSWATSGVRAKEFERAVTRTATAMEAATKAGRLSPAAVRETGRRAAIAAADGLERQFLVEQGRIREAQVRGLMTPKQASVAGRKAAVAFNNSLVMELNAARGGGAFRRGGQNVLTGLQGRLKNVDAVARSAGVGMHRLNNSMIVMARQATGAHPAVGQLVDIIGTFAIGTAKMVPILAGITAIGLGLAAISKEARDARKELQANLDVLRKIAEARAIKADGGETQIAISGVGAEARRIAVLAQQAQGLGNTDLFDAYIEKLRTLNSLIIDARMELADLADPARAQLKDALDVADRLRESRMTEAAGGVNRQSKASMEARLREIADRHRELETNSTVAGQAELNRLYQETLSLLGSIDELDIAINEETAEAAQRTAELTRRIDDMTTAAERGLTVILKRLSTEDVLISRNRERVASELAALRAHTELEEEIKKTLADQQDARDAILKTVEITLATIARHTAEDLARELELERARLRANNQLIRSLNNVGRAYGGVTGQVLALVAATLALERMPRESGTDQARAFGTSAALGAGFGTSTGSPALGALGGAASGFAVAGPIGAIVGGVTGLVSGLLEQGRRMEVARNVWDKALEGFASGAENLTVLESAMLKLNKSFAELAQEAAAASGVDDSAIDTVGEARTALAQISGGGGLGGVGGSAHFANALKRLVDAYDANTRAVEERFRLEQQMLQEDLQVRLLRAQGLEEEANALALAVQQERERTKAIELGYDASTIALLDQVQAEEARRAAIEATNDAIHSMTSALNDPSGLRLSLFRWRAEIAGRPDAPVRPYEPPPGLPPGPPSGPKDPQRPGGRGDTFIFNVVASEDPEETADEILRVMKRRGLLGGGDPYALVTR